MPARFSAGRIAEAMRVATENVFHTMVMVPIDREPWFHEQVGNQSFNGVVSLVGLGGCCVGSGRVACSPALACRISGALLVREFPGVNEDVLDAIAEITNMIVGNIKSALEDELGPMGLSIPAAIFGRNYHTRATGVTEWIVVPYRCESDRFEVRLCLGPGAQPGAYPSETFAT
jgi:chemotaxis protein CheX